MLCFDPNTDVSGVRIGYVLKRFPRLSETFILNELIELERQGVHLEIFSLKRPLNEPRHRLLTALRAKVTYLTSEMDADAAVSEELIDLVAGLSPAKSEHWPALAAKSIIVAQLTAAARLQHLHAHFASDPTTVALAAAKIARVPFSFTAHARDVFHCYVSREIDDGARRTKIDAAAFVTTVSEFNRRHLCQISGDGHGRKIIRLYNGIDIKRFKPASSQPPNSRTILFVGRLVAKKGVPDLIEACRILNERGVQFDCEIIGDGPLRETLTEQIQACDLATRVSLRGALHQDAVLKAMLGARVLALPCVVAASGDQDGLPTVLLEALAAGLPSISTNVAGIPEIIDHGRTGLLVNSSSPAMLADAIHEVLEDDTLAMRLANAGRKKAMSAFEVGVNVAHLRRQFERVVRSARRPNSLIAAAGSARIAPLT